jgi:TolB-like protein
MNWRLMSEPRGSDATAPPDEVRAQIERILRSQTLSGSDQLKRLLRLVVERTLNGQPELLKEYNLGLDVFQRPPDYDPKVDPIVRVQAGRLRSKLGEYYATEGAHDSVVIQIPKGAYVPVFDARNAAVRGQDIKSRRQRVWLAAAGLAVLVGILVVAWAARNRVAVPVGTDRSVAVLPLQDFTDSGSRGHIADQVAEVLTTELAKNKQLRVLSRTTASKYRETTSSLPEIARALGVRWVVEGGVGVQGSRAYVKLRAIDALTDRKVWADVFDCDLSGLVAANARAADSIAAAIVVELRSSPR